MSIEIIALDNSYVINGTQVEKGRLTITVDSGHVCVNNLSANLSDVSINGNTYNSDDAFREACDSLLFSEGGGAPSEGVQSVTGDLVSGTVTNPIVNLPSDVLKESDTSMFPEAGKVPVFSSQGLLSTNFALFPENAVPLQQMLSYVDNFTGWAIYNDTLYTQASPLVINEGVRTKININGATSIKTQLPLGVTNWWNSTTNKLTPSLVGDSYIVNLRFTAESSSITGLADVDLDIAGTVNIADGSTISLRKGSGNSQRISLKFDVYSLETFVTNGGEFYITSFDGNTSIYDIRLKITRVHKAK